MLEHFNGKNRNYAKKTTTFATKKQKTKQKKGKITGGSEIIICSLLGLENITGRFRLN